MVSSPRSTQYLPALARPGRQYGTHAPATTSMEGSSESAPVDTVAVARKRPYPFWLGATFAGAITHPLDLTKVRMQTTGDKGMLATIKNTIHTAGIRGLYDGLSGTILRQMSYSMIRFAAYDRLRSAMHTDHGPVPAWKLITAGGIAGGIAGTLGNPAELIMVRMMADKAKPLGKRYNYKNSLEGLYRMAQTEGIRSWFRGVAPNGIRSILMNASQLGSYDWFKHQLVASGLTDGPVVHFVASLGAGTVATTVCSPADVIKARMMTASASTSMLGVIRTSLKNEGPMFMFKGWLPAWTRLQPTTILIFLTLEQLRRGVDDYRSLGGTWL